MCCKAAQEFDRQQTLFRFNFSIAVIGIPCSCGSYKISIAEIIVSKLYGNPVSLIEEQCPELTMMIRPVRIEVWSLMAKQK